MPRQKDLKKLVRTRMRKTGEAYTAARAQILKNEDTGKTETVTSHARLAGMSDAAVKAKTGCTWERWVRTLDHYGAATMSHGDIARLVREKWKTSAWWSQMVAVGYERIKGLREKGQRRGGRYEASKSRTFGTSAAKVFDVT